MKTLIEQAALQLVAARLRHRAAKIALRLYREKCGACTDSITESGDRGDECYLGHRLVWCSVCLGSQPIWVEYRAAANAAGAAMRNLIQICSKEQ